MQNKLLQNKLFAFLKLIRFENLIMIALTQLFLRFFVLQKILNDYQINLELNNSLFFLLVLSTLLIAAAGYIINDYFDVKTDLINHPHTVVVDTVIKRRWAIILHLCFSALGIFLGVFAALKTGYLRLSLFHFVAVILLWFYSTHLKKKLLIGNIVVSLLTASVAFIPFVYEIGVLQHLFPGFVMIYKQAVLSSFKITFIFGLFAFITSMAREIIKDMEDYEGDFATGGQTIPIVWGLRSSKLIAFFFLVITAILLLFADYNAVKVERIIFSVNVIYILLMLVMPIIILALYTIQSKTTSDFRRASLILKLIMFAGLSYSIIYYYN